MSSYNDNIIRLDISNITIGSNAGGSNRMSTYNQGDYGIAIGYQAAPFGNLAAQGKQSIAIGYRAGYRFQNDRSIAIGYEAGYVNQTNNAIAIGDLAGNTRQAEYCVAIGSEAGKENQKINALAIGVLAGEKEQSDNAVAIGNNAGRYNQSVNSVAIGLYSGQTRQENDSIAIGNEAGQTDQSNNAIAIGQLAGNSTQGEHSVALGYQAGEQRQDKEAIAIGILAGQIDQSLNSIAIGTNAGQRDQKKNSVAIGNFAGSISQGENSIAIGNLAGEVGQSDSTIVINATSAAVNGGLGSSRCYINPIREVDASNVLLYNPLTYEVTTQEKMHLYVGYKSGRFPAKVSTNASPTDIDISGFDLTTLKSNIPSSYDTTTGIFTAPFSSLYNINYTVDISSNFNYELPKIHIMVNNSSTSNFSSVRHSLVLGNGLSTNNLTMNISSLYHLDKDDEVKCVLRLNSTNSAGDTFYILGVEGVAPNRSTRTFQSIHSI